MFVLLLLLLENVQYDDANTPSLATKQNLHV